MYLCLGETSILRNSDNFRRILEAGAKSMKTLVFLSVAAALPFLGRFQETKVFKNGRVIFEQSTYGQRIAADVMLIAAIVLLGAAWNERRKNTALGRKSRFVRVSPVIFALPATWQQWSGSRFGDANVYTEIKAGLGGPMTNLLIVAAAALFVAADAYWRQREGPNLPSGPAVA